jgi:carboxymethylenebutenolidase
MSDLVTLRASDGHELNAYVARPEGEPIAGLVVVQEIFGVNPHIRRVADGYARDGFLAIAPAIFDRIERGVELSYEGADMQRAMSFIPKLDAEKSLLDVEAATNYAGASTGKKTGVIGYCFGGTIAWLAATRLHPAVAVGYYGGGIDNYAAEEPRCPVMLHFGKDDAHIPAEKIDTVRLAHPDVEIYVYEGAGHGFNCDARASYNPEAAKLARERSLAFLKKWTVNGGK